MKIVTLNTWGGRAGRELLLDFFDRYRDVDVFCLQEVWSAPHKHLEGVEVAGWKIDHSEIMTQGMQEISALLHDHEAFFHPHFGDNYGVMMLVKKALNVERVGDRFVYREHGFIATDELANHARNVQYATIGTQRGPLSILNMHGLWNGKGKGDSPDRISQSQKVVEQVRDLGTPVVLCGDLNLRPDTESIAILERAGLRNLITEHHIDSTRTSLYAKPERYADYIFTSPELVIRHFDALPDEVSDHKALLVEVEYTS